MQSIIMAPFCDTLGSAIDNADIQIFIPNTQLAAII